MKKISHLYILSLMVMGLLISSCKKDDGPKAEDNFLNYKIEDVAPAKDYITGAFYTNFGTYNANIKEVPAVGKYSFVNGDIPAAVMTQHIDFAAKAKINYLIFSVRSANLEFNNYRQDSVFIDRFLSSANVSKVNFALSYSLNTGLMGISSTIPAESVPLKLEAFYKDFQRMAFYFKKTNYMKVNGKTLVILNNAQNFSANNNPAIYAEIRKRLAALGFELFIVGMQDRWSPPQRFYNRFQNCVDAMYEANMINTGDVADRVYLFPQMVDQAWKYWKKMLESWNIEFIPSISPAFTDKVNNPTSLNLDFKRGDGGAFYKTFCNVAKLNASKSGLIFIDSFNNFSVDSQLEPTAGYGELYLDITRQQFKVN